HLEFRGRLRSALGGLSADSQRIELTRMTRHLLLLCLFAAHTLERMRGGIELTNQRGIGSREVLPRFDFHRVSFGITDLETSLWRSEGERDLIHRRTYRL